MRQKITVHSSRTIMFKELEKVMDFSQKNDNYAEALQANVTGKRSTSGIKKTARYLKSLYSFDNNYPPFVAFRYFWEICVPTSKPVLALIFAINRDYLLTESIDVIRQVETGKKVSVEALEENIEKYHPGRYSTNTRHSIAQNIASSWKQAGFIRGKVKNIRTQPEINHKVVCFAFLLAYLSGNSGDYLWNTSVVRALSLEEKSIREMASECARKDMIHYQYAGNITVISFDNLLKKTGINEIKN